MGDPRKQRKKFQMPSHPWQKTRIDAEKVLKKEYGLKNKKEIWKMNSVLKRFQEQAKNLIRTNSEQAKKEEKLFLAKLVKLNLLSPDANIEKVLDLNVEDIMERRLQTVVARKGLARTTKQARQFIIHKHILIDGKLMNVPSYLVKLDEESKLEFRQSSSLSDEEHPERALKIVAQTKEVEEDSVKEDKVEETKKEEPKKEVKENKVKEPKKEVKEESKDGETDEK